MRGRQPRHDEEFRRFAKASLPALLKGAYLLLRDIDLAEDAVQGTLLRVFKHWETARAAPEAYSRQTLVNVCRDHWRRQARRPPETLVDDLSDLGEPFLDSGFEERQDLEQALAALPDTQREVLVLRFFFDLSVLDVAAVLGVPVGTVKSATHRGLEQLRVLLSPPAKEVETC